MVSWIFDEGGWVYGEWLSGKRVLMGGLMSCGEVVDGLFASVIALV